MKKCRFGHNYLSDYSPERIKLIRRLNEQLSLAIPEDTKFYYHKSAGQKSEGWLFNFYFSYEGRLYGASQSVTGLLRAKKYSTYNNGSNHIEIVETDE
jgi:hypothetical protein